MTFQGLYRPARAAGLPAPGAASASPRQMATGSAPPRLSFNALTVPVHRPDHEPPARRLPDDLQQGIVGLTGLSLQEVNVHYNSARPAGLRALAYTEGADIYIGPRQERYLPHEAWHAVQQKLGRVRPTAQLGGVAVNDDPDLEREADAMGAEASRGNAGLLSRGAPPAPPGAVPGAYGPVIQRMPGNDAYNAATANLNQEVEVEENYLDVVARNADSGVPPAYIVNAILSYREIGAIAGVIGALMDGFEAGPGGPRVAVVLGINAPDNEGALLDQAIAQAAQTIAQFPFPVAIVRSTFPAGGAFPYGRMRNEVLHSAETRTLTRSFNAAGLHPYISIQDFDTGARRVPDGTHIFNALDQEMAEGLRPLMIAGGYRPGPDLLQRTIARFQARHEDVPEELTQNDGEAFLEEFSSHIYEDMLSRREYAVVHPLLPYAPEPNLFLDALAVAHGGQLGLGQLRFGEGAAEFTQLAKALAVYEAAELQHHYAALHSAAAPDLRVAPVPPEQLGHLDLAAMAVDPQEVFIEEDVPPLPSDQQEIESAIQIQAETGSHPLRGLTYRTGFLDLAIETDLSRLAYGYLGTGKKLQSHSDLRIPSERFFDSKGARSNTSMAEFNTFFDKADPEQREAIRKGLLESGSKVAKKPFLPFRGYNVMSSALSAPLGGPFSSLSTGIQPSQKLAAFGAVARALPQAVERLAFLLSLKLSRVANGTPMDGNCLYHAVIQAQNGGHVDMDAATALRQQAVTWALQDAHLPEVSQYAFEHGVPVDTLIDTLSQNGNWSGNQGDLTPRVVASAIQRNIRIVTTTGQIYLLPPLGGPVAQTVTIQLDVAQQHYSVP